MLSKKSGYGRGLIASLLVFALICTGGIALLNGIDNASVIAEENLVRDAVRQAMITCYAVEGAYPSDVGYLKDNYGLAYNENEFFVFYDAFASNILPEIRVTRKGAEA